ncbi:nuclear transport factor 2 family protein [Pontibacter oryzae]|uniref:Nuclear transport factor 2 family protein n=1 Tax=Pontibacter oryzae TaxID=2304593 RepID=A0A399RRS6_9BACT|nr:nuclear transport factor 2 family protein [Pontibacter oryzae]RIJ33501.1 nuclear transport factor 2 family protein [Pontibacter oryzae]
MSNNAQKKEIIESYVKAYNAFDVAGMSKHMHPDIVFENISNGITSIRIMGISAFKQQAEAAAHYFLERQQQIKSIAFKSDEAEAEIAYKGIVAMDLPNGMKAGDKLTLAGKSIFYFEGDKITRLQDIS